MNDVIINNIPKMAKESDSDLTSSPIRMSALSDIPKPPPEQQQKLYLALQSMKPDSGYD